MRKKKQIVAALIIFPLFLFIIYRVMKLDTVGGFFEDNELAIKIILSITIMVGSIILFSNSVREIKKNKKEMLWIFTSIFTFFLALLSIILVYSFRHGVGF